MTHARLIALVLISLTTLAARAEDKPAAHKDVTAAEFEKLTAEPNTVILDVRTPREYEAGHIKNAVLIDVSAQDFDKKVKDLDKSKTYLVYCAVGMRGTKACKKMTAAEFPKLYNLTGGIKAWNKEGKPLEK